MQDLEGDLVRFKGAYRISNLHSYAEQMCVPQAYAIFRKIPEYSQVQSSRVVS